MPVKTAPTRMTIRCLIPLGLLALTACVEIGALIPQDEPEAPPVRVLPPAVRAALLPGVPENIVIEDGRGCYLVSIEVTEPRQGYLVNDASGAPLCYDDLGNRIPRSVPAVPDASAIAAVPEIDIANDTTDAPA